MNELQKIVYYMSEEIKKSEGYQRYWYNCPAKIVTIGFGFASGTFSDEEFSLISKNRGEEISKQSHLKFIKKTEAELIVQNRIIEIYEYWLKFNWFRSLKLVRKKVVIDMSYNMGISKVREFKKMINYLENQDYKKASYEIKNSEYYRNSFSIKRTCNLRAAKNAERMRTGEEKEKVYSCD